MPYRFFRLSVLLILSFFFVNILTAQTRTGRLRGDVSDPSGAIIPGASIVLSGNGKNINTTSGDAGNYSFNDLAPGHYAVTTTIDGFTPYELPDLAITAGKTRTLNISLSLAVQQQQVTVTAENNSIDTSPDTNANAVLIKGKDLDALSDDPDELASELQALAGPSAGPNGGQIYIDGFSGGEIPPKSSIREIRVNENPFSAEFDRLGYGRIEILTKAGTGNLHGHVYSRGNYSAFNAQNPILNSNRASGQPPIKEPSYYSYFIYGNVGGPMTDHSSFFLNLFERNNENVNVVQAIDPGSITPATPNGLPLNETVNNPSSRFDLNPRFDFQFGQSNTLAVRYSYYRSAHTNSGIGELALPEQGYNTLDQENELQASDDLVLSKNFADSIRFQFRRIRNKQAAQYTSPAVNVQGSFVDGGNSSGTLQDHQDNYEFQDYFTGSKGSHALNFGARLRAYHDANYTNGGTNGAYTFQSAATYLNRTPQKYQVTVVNNNQYTARATPFDAALFYQDDWKVNQRFTLSYGLRWETQNEISDKSDWAPRFYFAYALDHKHGRPKNVLRAGYGWFYQRFTVPNGSYGAPYIIDTIHHNLPANPSTPSNQQIYIVTNPSYAETSPGNAIKPPDPALGSATPAATYYTIAPNFHAALDMQGAIGVDHQIAKNVTSNVTYLYSRGVHQFLSNNSTAPYFDGSTNTYPATPLLAPPTNIYQYQSGAVYREDQIIATVNARLKNLSVFGFYTYSNAKGDSDSVHSFSSNAHDPGQDYGRTAFDVSHRFLILGDFTAPYAISVSPFFVFHSGTPFNITTGSDLTGNNQFNARPTFAATDGGCTAPMVPYGHYCLNPNPAGTNEKIIPYDLGTGPSNYSLNLRVSKVIGFGARIKGHGGGGGPHGHGGGGGLGGRGLSGNQSGPASMDASTPHKYSLTLSAYASNLFNSENLGTPNGTLTSPFFGKSQSLAGGFFSPSTAGNRSIFLQTSLNF